MYKRQVKPSIIIKETIELAEIDASNMGINIIQKIQTSLPLINVDPILIEQVLLNLIKNGLESMKGTEENNLTLVVEASKTEVIFSVHDNGPGVSSEIEDKLFESFFPRKAKVQGSGSIFADR